MPREPHKRAGAAISVETTLTSEQLATICKDAADQTKARLEDVKPGELTFSFRAPLAPERIHLMTFKVRLSQSGTGRHRLVSRITHYKTKQSKAFLIPLEPRRMSALNLYERFMGRLADLARHADPDAQITIAG
jgi:hypothetical protein